MQHILLNQNCKKVVLMLKLFFSLQVELVTQAVEKDSIQEYKEAISLYCQALEYFVPAIHCEY